jgi:RNA polymerase sigma-70 factor, ECF subfamily
MLTSLSDEELAEQAKTDTNAFSALYERHIKRVYSYVYFRTNSVPDAEDLTERTFFQVMENLHRYEYRGVPFSAWLFRIAHNLVANWHRDRARRRLVPLDEAGERESTDGDPSTEALAVEERQELRGAIGRLPPERQFLLVLKFSEGRSNSEIADQLGRTEGAVKALLHRTLVALKADLAGRRNSKGPTQ